MRKLVPIFGVIIASCTFGFGQTPEKLSCPTVIVNGPAGVPKPGQTEDFTASVVGTDETTALEYFWAVEPKRNFTGQGTATIRVEYPNYEALTAVVTIKGLPSACPNTASETYSVDPAPQAKKIGEISDFRYFADKKLLKSIVGELREQPYAMLYVVMQFRRGTSAKAMMLSRKRLADQLYKSKINLEPTRFILADNGNREVIFWLVPPGANVPFVDK